MFNDVFVGDNGCIIIRRRKITAVSIILVALDHHFPIISRSSSTSHFAFVTQNPTIGKLYLSDFSFRKSKSIPEVRSGISPTTIRPDCYRDTKVFCSVPRANSEAIKILAPLPGIATRFSEIDSRVFLLTIFPLVNAW